MPISFTEAKIQTLIEEEKEFPSGYREILIGKKMRTEDSHKRGEIVIVGDTGNRFYVKTRQSIINPLDFSLILAYEVLQSNTLVNLQNSKVVI